jgi:nucleoid-associated protein YgaU
MNLGWSGAEDAVVGLCLLALLGCALWTWAAICAAAVEAWRRGAALSVAGCGWVRRWVLAACGIALAGAVHGQAHAVGTDDGSLDGLPMPERAIGPASTSGLAVPVRRVLVRPGDSLWVITARTLPAGATDAAIDAGWRRLYRLNRTVVGPDPDLIHPGQLLRLPTLPTAT